MLKLQLSQGWRYFNFASILWGIMLGALINCIRAKLF